MLGVVTSEQPLIPTEYQQTDYVENQTIGSGNQTGSGTQGVTFGGYINLGIHIAPSTDRLYVEYQCTDYSKYDGNKGYFGCLYGDYWGDATKGIYNFITKTEKIRIRCAGSTVNMDTAMGTTKHTLDVYHDSILYDGTQIGANTGAYNNASTSTELLFCAPYFAPNTSPTGDVPSVMAFFIGKIYAFKVYRSGVLIHDYYPCYRKSDNKAGVYDIIAQEFKQGLNDLLAGNDE